jgi:hypothetical protein
MQMKKLILTGIERSTPNDVELTLFDICTGMIALAKNEGYLFSVFLFFRIEKFKKYRKFYILMGLEDRGGPLVMFLIIFRIFSTFKNFLANKEIFQHIYRFSFSELFQ